MYPKTNTKIRLDDFLDENRSNKQMKWKLQVERSGARGYRIAGRAQSSLLFFKLHSFHLRHRNV